MAIEKRLKIFVLLVIIQSLVSEDDLVFLDRNIERLEKAVKDANSKPKFVKICLEEFQGNESKAPLHVKHQVNKIIETYLKEFDNMQTFDKLEKVLNVL